MLRLLFVTLTLAMFSQTALAVTLHIDMTPGHVGKKGVTVKALDNGMTRFTIRVNTTNDPKAVARRAPFVRQGSLDIRSENGRTVQCSIQPKKRGDELLYTFEIESEHAECSWFTLAEHFDDGQVGAGKVFSYRLIDFIDPGYRATELLQNIRLLGISEAEFAAALLPPSVNERVCP